jgi:hypothetical protein
MKFILLLMAFFNGNGNLPDEGLEAGGRDNGISASLEGAARLSDKALAK